MTLPLERIPYNRHDWEESGICRRPDVDWRIFFPPDEDKGVKQEQAKRHCAVCPVKGHCFMKAMAMRERPEGIWGGTSTKERQKLRKNRSRAHCPVCSSVDVGRVLRDGSHYEVCISCGVSWRADADPVTHSGARPADGRASGVVDLELPETGAPELGLTA